MIRRPVIYVAAAFVSAILVCVYLNVYLAFIPVIIIAIRTLSTNNQCGWIVLFFYIVSLINFQMQSCNFDEISKYINDNTKYCGKINSVQIKENGTGEKYFQLKIDVNHIENRHISRKERVLVNYYKYDTSMESILFPGEETVFHGIAQKPSKQRNPGGFNQEMFLRSVNIKHIIVANDMFVYTSSQKNNLLYKIKKTLYFSKEDYLKNLKYHAGDTAAGFMRALLFGNKNELSDNIQEDFQKNGTAHILAVSGLHIGIIYGFISKIWIWKKNTVFFVLITVFFCSYMFLADFSPSVVRAVAMLEMHSFAIITKRKYDIVSSALVVLTVVLFRNPYSIFNVSIQMSYLAIMAIGMILPVIRKRYNGIFLSSISVQIGLLPYTIYMFNYLSVISVVINIPIIFFTGILVPVGLVNMFLSITELYLFKIMSVLISGLCDIIIYFNSMTCIDGITSYNIVSPNIIFLLLFYFILGILFSEEGRLLYLRRKYKKIIKYLMCAVFVAISLSFIINSDLKGCNIVFVDVGQGDCIHITAGKKNYLIDGGGNINYNIGKSTLKSYLLKNGVRKIDGAFVTHLHTDHYKGIVELCHEGMVEKLYVYESNRMKIDAILDETLLDEEDVFFLHKGNKVLIGEDIVLKVLWPEKKSDYDYIKMIENESDENESSLIMKIEACGISVMATGDVDKECQDELAEIYGETLDCDIMKVAHHGSKYSYSEEFLDYADPEYAVVQVGKNNFGHPNEGVIENYSKKGIMLYRNDLDGAIGFKKDKKGKLKAKTMIERQ